MASPCQLYLGGIFIGSVPKHFELGDGKGLFAHAIWGLEQPIPNPLGFIDHEDDPRGPWLITVYTTCDFWTHRNPQIRKLWYEECHMLKKIVNGTSSDLGAVLYR